MAISLAEIGKSIKQWYFAVRSDAGTLAQFRILILGLVACSSIYYGADSVLLAPKMKKIKSSTTRLTELSGSATTVSPDLAPAIVQLNQKKKQLAERIEILKTKERFLHEEWTIISDADRFSNIIFTSLPGAPVNIKKNLDQMSLIKTRLKDGFEIQPVELAGKARFHDFLSYLRYLESRAEAGPVESLTIESIPAKEPTPSAPVHFNILISRMKFQEAS